MREGGREGLFVNSLGCSYKEGVFFYMLRKGANLQVYLANDALSLLKSILVQCTCISDNTECCGLQA